MLLTEILQDLTVAVYGFAIGALVVDTVSRAAHAACERRTRGRRDRAPLATVIALPDSVVLPPSVRLHHRGEVCAEA